MIDDSRGQMGPTPHWLGLIVISATVVAIVFAEVVTLQTNTIEEREIAEVGGPFIEPEVAVIVMGLAALVVAGSFAASWIRDRVSAKADRDSANGGESA
ncbi:MAG: hypothetical protein RI568_16010 [Natronomonas sp.]|uniref:hypothetical protein n=1 Tax=Natronomonas sp. TaxID=2184060 RepID=UPI00286FB296|nr:hypothetical protein [Natronomonas sp.]MDR9432185.1 hypothetical protein [Natronomonas sp.]